MRAFNLIKGRFGIGIRLSAVVCLVFVCASVPANAPIPRPEASSLLPPELQGFRLIGRAEQLKLSDRDTTDQLKLIVNARYGSADGAELEVTLYRWETDSAAYASLTSLRKARGQDSVTQGVGTDSAAVDRGVVFFKGTASVTVLGQTESQRSRVLEFARLFAATLDDGGGDVPVLVRHLPNWEVAQRHAIYALHSGALTLAVPNQPILNEINFDGGTETVTANYDQSQIVIVEFTTPQLSIDNDQRIWTKIGELKSKGEPTPTAYRRVGNYSVFVFNAADEKTANALIDQVKYEQVVQWLGDDPHLYERMQRYFAETSAGVLVAVLKSSGLSLLFCVTAGAIIGMMLFRRRRAQRAAAYSDAGGSIRLNLDDLTGPVKSQRLLPGAKQSEQHSTNS
jgi:hypothetical protein